MGTVQVRGGGGSASKVRPLSASAELMDSPAEPQDPALTALVGAGGTQTELQCPAIIAQHSITCSPPDASSSEGVVWSTP